MATAVPSRRAGWEFVDCDQAYPLSAPSWLAPAEGEVFNCDPKYLVTVSTPEVANAQLDENRRSTRYTGG